jgi:hypothetical protein
MKHLVTGERGVRGDTPANHAGGVGSIPASRSKSFQDFSTLDVRAVESDLAKKIIVENHYSHKWNDAFGRENFGLFEGDVLFGVAVYGYPMNPKAWSSITSLDGKKCLELNRLWIDDQMLTNSETWLISQSSKLLKQSGYRLVQSFADGRLGVGTIYQAANFSYYGFHETLFHEHLGTGEVFHDTPFTHTSRSDTMIQRNILHAQQVLKSFKVKTYRYLLPLDRAAKRSILLPSMSYPKNRNGVKHLPNYQPPVTQIARAAALAQKMHRSKDFGVLKKYLESLMPDVDALIEEQLQNEWVSKVRADVPLFEL